jgi:hypothetical protein
MHTCGSMALPHCTATWLMMLLSIVDGVSRPYLLLFILGNDAYVWLYDPTLWYYCLADDATYGPLLMVFHVYIFYVFFLGNDAYVWLYDPTPWYYYLADDAFVLC